MLHVGLDLSRRKVDVCRLSGEGEIVDEWASPPDADGLRGLAARAAIWGRVVRGVIESMNGAPFVHDPLAEHGWEVLIADATKVKGAGAAGLQDRQDRRACAGHPVGPRSRAGDLVARSEQSPRARARALWAAPGAPPHHAKEPHSRRADRLRSPVPGLRSVREPGDWLSLIVRDGRPLSPDAATRLAAGDRVFVLAEPTRRAPLARLFTKAE
jgi:hypothetical protein